MASDKEEIRERNDIVEVIGTYVALKKRGRNHVGLCPFHQEKTPSFHVDQTTQSFKCFGCGIGGDLYTFIQRYENMTFIEAAEFLARRAGLTFERRGAGAEGEQQSERERLFEINRAAAEWFRRMLDRVPVAREYVYDRRGLAHETIQRFQIGYAPDGWDGLTGYLQAQRHDLRLAATAGLVNVGRTGDYYDVFRHRIIFPIHDEQERVVGFGGRAFGDEPPKYLNTGETPLFAKSRLLYGLPFARRRIAADGQVLLMEGYMDVLAAHQAGFTSAVATLGTSLTEEHAKKLARLMPANPVVILVYDADSAGIKATLRASEMLEKEGILVKVVRLPEGDDPDSLLRREGGGGVALFQKAIDAAAGRVEYQLERIIAGADQSGDAGRAKMLTQIVHILASIPTRTERDVYINRVWRYHPMSAHSPALAAEQLHRDAEAVAARKRSGRGDARKWGNGEMGKWATQQPNNPTTQSPGTQRPLTGEERAERELLRALADPEWRESALKRVDDADLLTPLARRLFAFARAHPEARRADETELLRLLDAQEEEDFSSAVRELLQEFHALMANVPITDELLEQCAAALRRHQREQTKETLKQELAQLMQKTSLTEEEKERAREYQRLLSELRGSARA
jgi:DNA primase